MFYRLMVLCLCVVLGLVSAASADDRAAVPSAASEELVVHEWGTFTVLSDGKGLLLDWRPLSGPSDLPSFVYRASNPAGPSGGQGNVRCHYHGKGCSQGVVRMETPVIYFYGATKPTEVTVKVNFPDGTITEWYPKARAAEEDFVDWGRFLVAPSDTPTLLTESAPSHYYPARETDAQLVRVCDSPSHREPSYEFERFLFYRGVGSPKLPVSASVSGDTVQFQYKGKGAAPRFVLFERKGDEIGVQLIEANKSASYKVQRPARVNTLDDVTAMLHAELVAHGLFEKEAAAMLKTWHDTWFEDGLRVFVVLPRAQVDVMLPLTITPTPKALERVIVTRVEVLTPEQEAAVHDTIQKMMKADDADLPRLRDTFFATHGHFGEALLLRLLDKAKDAKEGAILNSLLSQ